MTETSIAFIAIFGLIILFIVKEIINYLHTKDLEKLLKANTLREYYVAKDGKIDPNTISTDDPNTIELNENPIPMSSIHGVQFEGDSKVRHMQFFGPGEIPAGFNQEDPADMND